MSERAPPTKTPPTPPGGFAAISKYNPHLWSAEQLRAIFVARQHELADLMHCLRSTPPGTVGQHALLVGARGMGKSTLMQRLALAVEDDAQLCRGWLALRFPEEQYTVNTLGQFWANVLDCLADALERQGISTRSLDASAQRIAQHSAAEQAAAYLQAINQCADERSQRLLLLVDNTDLLLHNLGTAAHWGLREVLQSNARMLWVGGSYQSLEANSSYHDAFLDFFQVIELQALSMTEMQQALQALAQTFGGDAARVAMQGQLSAHPERLATLRQLSGGNPRTTVMLYELFSSGQAGHVRSDLEALLDNMTPLYKARLEALADLPRKLLAHVLEHWAPITLAQLARSAQVPKTSISPQLQRLELEGLIQKTKLQGTTRSGYQAAERFFNIWYLMRLSPRRQRNRLSWLVEFMRLWFSADELRGIAKGRMAGSPSGTQRNYDWEYSRAIADALPQDDSSRHALRWSLLKHLQGKHSDLAQLFEFDGEDQDFKGAADYLQRLKPLPELLRRCPHAKTEEEKQVWVAYVLGSVSLSLAEKERVANAADRLSTFQYIEMIKLFQDEWRLWREQLTEAGADVLRAKILAQDFFPDIPDSRLAYEQIRVCFEGASEPLLTLVCGLHDNKFKDAWTLKTNAFIQHAYPQSAAIARHQARLLHVHLKDYNKAETAYRQAIALDAKSVYSWGGMGDLLQYRLNRFDEAEAAYRQAIALDAKSSYSWGGLGDLLQYRLNRFDEAEAAYRQAIALDEKSAAPWNGLGNLLQDHLNRFDEAEAAYRQAIALDEKSAAPWNGMGNLLQAHLNRFDEAEAAYRQAIALDEKFAHPWNGLGNLLQDHLNRFDEAEAAYQRAIELAPDDVWVKANLARLLWRHKRMAEALPLYQQVADSNSLGDRNALLQAYLALNQTEAGLTALHALALAAQEKNSSAFYQLQEQVWECTELGLGTRLAQWMAGSEDAAFLQPFIQALYMLADAPAHLQDLPQEIQHMADEVVAMARQRLAKQPESQGGQMSKN